MKLTTIQTPGGAKFQVNADYADKFQSLLTDLEAAGYAVNGRTSGGYNPRNIAGTNTPSNHAFGRAIDINWDRNAQGTQGDIPAELARSLATKYGMRWGGDYKTAKPDPMHFEIAGPSAAPPVAQRSMFAYAGVPTAQAATSAQAPQTTPAATPAPAIAPQAVAAAPQPAPGVMQDLLARFQGQQPAEAPAMPREDPTPALEPMQTARVNMDLPSLRRAVKARLTRSA